MYAYVYFNICVHLFMYYYSSAKDPEGRDVDYFMERLKFFINLYQRNDIEVNAEVYSNFQAFLDTYDTYENETFYNTWRVAKMVRI